MKRITIDLPDTAWGLGLEVAFWRPSGTPALGLYIYEEHDLEDGSVLMAVEEEADHDQG